MPKSTENPSADIILRAKARQLIQSGVLPSRRPDRMFGARGLGHICAVCGVAVAAKELEWEMQFNGEDGVGSTEFHIHIRCYEILEFEKLNPEVVSEPSLAGEPVASTPALPAKG